MKNSTLILSLFLSLQSLSQTASDTLNRFDSNNKKTGFWVAYVDSTLTYVDKEKADFVILDEYFEGKKVRYGADKRGFDLKTATYNNSVTNYIDSLPVLNGSLQFKGAYFESTFTHRNGALSTFEEKLYSSDTASFGSHSIHYFDSLYQNTPGTFLTHEYKKAGLDYRYYFVRDHRKYVYLDSNCVTHYSMNAPRIGYTYQYRNFVELGYTRTFGNRTNVGNGKTTFDDMIFAGFSVSMLGSWDEKHGNFLGQKAMMTLTTPLTRTEVGIVNYNQLGLNDMRLSMGIGLSAFGFVNFLYSYSIPLTNQVFSDISRHSFSILIF